MGHEVVHQVGLAGDTANPLVLVFPQDRKFHRLGDPRSEETLMEAATELCLYRHALTASVPTVDEKRDSVLECPLRLPLGDLGIFLGVHPKRRKTLGMPENAPPQIDPITFPDRAVNRAHEDVRRDGLRGRHNVTLLDRQRRQKSDPHKVSGRDSAVNREVEADLCGATRRSFDDEMEPVLAVGGHHTDRSRSRRSDRSQTRGQREGGGHVRIDGAFINDYRRQSDRSARTTDGRISQETANHKVGL